MGMMASQITSLMIVYSIVQWGADQRDHQSSASLAFVWGIHRWLVNSLHKWPVMWKMFPFDDVIMMMSLPEGSNPTNRRLWYFPHWKLDGISIVTYIVWGIIDLGIADNNSHWVFGNVLVRNRPQIIISHIWHNQSWIMAYMLHTCITKTRNVTVPIV